MHKKFLWTLWAILPILGLTYHYGPGQRAFLEDRAARLLAEANQTQQVAEDAQNGAYEKHLEALHARRDAFLNETPEAAAKVKAAGEAEEAAYKSAAEAWRTAADSFGRVQAVLISASSDTAQRVRVAKGRAQIRSGQIGTGVQDLQDMLDNFEDAGESDAPVARAAREELATGYYYGARLMRLAGKPTAEWRQVSGLARQNFRYLAETEKDSGAARNLQNNLELVLNLEQSSVEDLQAKAQPKKSPRAGANGIIPGKGRRSPLPPRRGDARNGASGTGEIGGGW